MRPCRRLALLVFVLLIGARAMGAAGQVSTAHQPTWTFNSPGVYTVTFQACNWAGCSAPLSRSITVLDPQPAITLATTEGSGSLIGGGAVFVHAGELVHLRGNGTGQPALAFQWQIIPATVVPTLPVAILDSAEGWWDTTGMAPGIYSAVLYLSNEAGAVDTHLAAIAITVLPDEPLLFYTLTPCRVFDSRESVGPLVSGQAITIPANTCGIPANARALAANLTVISPTATGYLNLYPGNYPVPPTAETSFRADVTRANEVVVGVSTAGPQTLAARAEISGGGSLHLIVDVNGYFAPAPPDVP